MLLRFSMSLLTKMLNTEATAHQYKIGFLDESESASFRRLIGNVAIADRPQFEELRHKIRARNSEVNR